MNPRDLLRSTRPGAASAPAGVRLKVLAALRIGKLDAATRSRLEKLGLTIHETIANKLVGAIAADKLDALKADPAVEEVETSVELRRH